MLLYFSSEIGTYAGDDETFPEPQVGHCRDRRDAEAVQGPSRIPRCVASTGGQLGAGASPAARPEAAGPAARSAAGPDLSCAERGRHAERTFHATIRRAARRQFVGGSARAPALA